MIQSLKVTAISISVSPTLCYAFETTVLDLAFFSFPFSWACEKVAIFFNFLSLIRITCFVSLAKCKFVFKTAREPTVYQRKY